MRSIGDADGCRSGWFLAAEDLGSEKIFCERCFSTCDLFEKGASLEVLALVIPIGSTDKGLRQYDL
jgi:predicted RNase H-like nuclease